MSKIARYLHYEDFMGPISPSIWVPDIRELIVAFLSPNEIACTIRLVDKSSAEQFKNFTITHLSQPVPHHAFQGRWGDRGACRPLDRKQRSQLLTLTAVSGSISNLKLALKSAGLTLQPGHPGRPHLGCRLLHAAAKAGQWRMCNWLHSKKFVPVDHLEEAIGASGCMDTCEWFFLVADMMLDVKFGCLSKQACKVLCGAARSGRTEYLRWLMEVVLPTVLRSPSVVNRSSMIGGLAEVDPCDLLAAAAEGCDLATLRHLHQQWPQLLRQWTSNKKPQSTKQWPPAQEQRIQPVALSAKQVHRLLCAAACSTTADWREKIEWLESLMPPPQGEPDAQQQPQQQNQGQQQQGQVGAVDAGGAAAAAALQRSLAVCEASLSRPAGDAADRVAWLSRRGYALSPELLLPACEQGSVAAVRLLLTELRGIVPTVLLPAMRAAAGGHMDVLRMLHEYSPLPDDGFLGWTCLDLDNVLESALRGGHLEVATWLMEELSVDVRADEEDILMTAAVSSGKPEAVTLLRQRGCPWSPECFSEAAETGCEAMVEALVAQGCPRSTRDIFGDPYVSAAGAGDLAMMRCLRRQGVPWDPRGRTFSQVVKLVGNDAAGIPLLRCLLKLGCPVNWVQALRLARAAAKGPFALLGVVLWLSDMQRQAGERKLKRLARIRRKQQIDEDGAGGPGAMDPGTQGTRAAEAVAGSSRRRRT